MPHAIDDEHEPPSVLVMGATGNLGRQVVQRLTARGVRPRGLARRRPASSVGVDWVTGDVTDAGSMRSALTGIDTTLVTWPLLDSDRACALLGALAGAGTRVAYVSSTAIDDTADRQSDPIVQVHADMERALEGAGLPVVVLRCDTLASNVRGWRSQLREGDVISGPALASTAVVDERDVADAAVAVLLDRPERSPTGPWLLTGPEVLGRADQAAQLGAVLGRDLRFEPVAVEAARSRLLAGGAPEQLVEALLAAAEARPASRLVTDHVEQLTGHPAGTFGQWALDHADELA